MKISSSPAAMRCVVPKSRDDTLGPVCTTTLGELPFCDRDGVRRALDVLRHLLHRSDDRAQLVLGAREALRRRDRPALRRSGELIDPLGHGADEQHDDERRADRRIDPPAKQATDEWAQQEVEQQREGDRDQELAREIQRVEQRERGEDRRLDGARAWRFRRRDGATDVRRGARWGPTGVALAVGSTTGVSDDAGARAARSAAFGTIA